MKLVITDAKRFHCGQMARSMRVEHHAALLKMGVPIHHELRRVFDLSYYSRAAFVDGHLAGLWGMEGSMLSSCARVWLVLSQYALRFPVAIIRQAKAELGFMAATKTELQTTLIPDDEPAHRLAVHLGFESADGFSFGPAQTRMMRGRLLSHLRNNPDLMVNAGAARQVAVVWRRDRQEASDADR